MNAGEFLDEILMLGLDDWVHAPQVVWAAREKGGATTTEEIMDLALAAIQRGLDEGLLTIGGINAQGVFQPWDRSASDALELVRSKWIALKGPPGLGDLFWLNNTTRGDARGAEAMRGENESDRPAEV